MNYESGVSILYLSEEVIQDKSITTNNKLILATLGLRVLDSVCAICIHIIQRKPSLQSNQGLLTETKLHLCEYVSSL